MQIMRARLESAQHILQHILIHEYQAEQVAYEIYDDRIRLVVKSPLDLTEIPMKEFEQKVNAVVKQNLPVTDQTYKRSEVPADIDLKLAPENVEDIRVVSIGDFDRQPCHNLHITNTSEIGVYHLVELRKDGKDTYKFISQVT